MPKYPKGHEFEYKILYPSQIKFDPLYQRQLDARRIDKIVKEFDGDVFNEPKVSYRDGCFWCFNGQHSIAAWKKIHNNQDKPLTCKVFKGMTWVEECEAFIKQNGIAKDPTSNDKLRAEWNKKDPDVCDMVDTCELCGFLVDFVNSKMPTRIVATSTLFRAYKSLGHDVFQDMMLAIKESWYGDPDAVSNQIISGMKDFYKAYYGHFKHDDLVKSLRKVQPIYIIRNGKTYTSKKNGYAFEIVKTYNKSRSKYRMDETKI